jgi:hypothetical protein
MSFAHQLRSALRHTAGFAATILPPQYGIRTERFLRGWEEYWRLKDCDVVIVSSGKSGRTWLRVLLSRYYQQRYRLPASRLLNNDNLHRLNAAVPRVLFTHDNYLSDFIGISDSKTMYADKRVIVLVRNPADTAVSQYFQWKHRTKLRKKIINSFPISDSDVSISDFVFGEAAGIPKIVHFMNDWAANIETIRDILVVRYESLHAATTMTLRNVLAFAGEEATTDELHECVRFASIENMRALEHAAFFRDLGNRLRPGDATNLQSYKVRRAKVGGYRDYFTDEEADRIDVLIEETLSPIYGYCSASADGRII